MRKKTACFDLVRSTKTEAPQIGLLAKVLQRHGAVTRGWVYLTLTKQFSKFKRFESPRLVSE
jgi:hypothetical protein